MALQRCCYSSPHDLLPRPVKDGLCFPVEFIAPHGDGNANLAPAYKLVRSTVR